MIQLYFLSVLCNGLSGYILFTGKEDETAGKTQDLFKEFSINNPVFNLVLGILSAVTGILKLLSPAMGGFRFPIFGDLIPSAAGIIAGFLLIFGIYRKETSSESIDRLASSLLNLRKPLGLGLLAAALIHFLFPEALFL
ncbi:MAG: hypothetical protein LBQ89_06115 [Treponema sp.]|jgi:hypothetical protein|nr:hypothetical protein [Treponema sp.]